MTRITAATCLQLLTSGKYSDLIIDCQGVEFKVHRMVVCSQSAMIDAACSGKFKEAESGRIKFPEQEPDILARAILFMYTGDYDAVALPEFYSQLYLDEEEQENEAVNKTTHNGQSKEIDELGLRHALKVNVLMYQCADMLGINDLSALASTRFMEHAKVAFDLDGFEEPMQLLYENTRVDDRELRFKLTKLCVENYDLLEIRDKTLAVLQEHEPNVWNVSVEIMKDWYAERNSDLKKAVDECNRIARQKICAHSFQYPIIELALEEDMSLVMTCSICAAGRLTPLLVASHPGSA